MIRYAGIGPPPTSEELRSSKPPPRGGPKLKVIGLIRFAGADGTLPLHHDLLAAICERKRWDLIRVVEENGTPDTTPLAERSALAEAIEAIDRGEAAILVVTDLGQIVSTRDHMVEIAQMLGEVGGHLCDGETGHMVC
jgi:DNA invertase Pin-like site-specific DNA recombinase